MSTNSIDIVFTVVNREDVAPIIGGLSALASALYNAGNHACAADLLKLASDLCEWSVFA